jgi:hypothetical protein
MKSFRRAWNIAAHVVTLASFRWSIRSRGLQSSNRETPTATYEELVAFRTKAKEMGTTRQIVNGARKRRALRNKRRTICPNEQQHACPNGKPVMPEVPEKIGAGEGNRTLVFSLEGLKLLYHQVSLNVIYNHFSTS